MTHIRVSLLSRILMRPINTIGFAAAVGSFAVSITAFAQSYPLKTVRIIVPTGPGGGNDVQARLMAKRFSESMGQPFFVENRPGASGIIGTEITSKAPPDGYTLLAKVVKAGNLKPE